MNLFSVRDVYKFPQAVIILVRLVSSTAAHKKRMQSLSYLINTRTPTQTGCQKATITLTALTRKAEATVAPAPSVAPKQQFVGAGKRDE